MRILYYLLVSLLLVNGGVCFSGNDQAGGSQKDVCFYVSSSELKSSVKFSSVFPLPSDGVIVGGSATSLDWLPANVKRLQVQSQQAENLSKKSDSENSDSQQGDKKKPFLLFLSSDVRKIQLAVLFPDSVFESIDRIEAPVVPGRRPGALYVSGQNANGYAILRLNVEQLLAANKSSQPRLDADWRLEFQATGIIKTAQPWDIDQSGRLICAVGEPYSYNWLCVEAYGPDGKPVLMPHWRSHWLANDEKYYGDPSKAPSEPIKSGIILKTWGRGDLRSWTKEDYLKKVPDGNGGLNQGAWPWDGMFAGYFDPETQKEVTLNEDKRGWYGYRWGATPTACVGAIKIDRRDGTIYIGGNNQSRLPDGNPDFEPWLMAMQPDGKLKWWVRLYPESKGVSTPDQYIDALEIDYSAPLEQGGRIAVVARCHGNNVNNFWDGNRINYPDPVREDADGRVPRKSFQPSFTGTNSNIHLLWLGQIRQSDGRMLAATYCGEYNESGPFGNKPFEQENLRHWPDISTGWAGLNTTRLRCLSISPSGRPIIGAVGRRVITTRNAYMEMPSPLNNPESKGKWSDFLRVYEDDLSAIVYSTLASGSWDWTTGKGGSDVQIADAAPLTDGTVVAVGYAPLNKEGRREGNDMPTRNAPSWGTDNPLGESAVLMKIKIE